MSCSCAFCRGASGCRREARASPVLTAEPVGGAHCCRRRPATQAGQPAGAMMTRGASPGSRRNHRSHPQVRAGMTTSQGVVSLLPSGRPLLEDVPDVQSICMAAVTSALAGMPGEASSPRSGTPAARHHNGTHTPSQGAAAVSCAAVNCPSPTRYCITRSHSPCMHHAGTPGNLHLGHADRNWFSKA